jgi:hypothetical protein
VHHVDTNQVSITKPRKHDPENKTQLIKEYPMEQILRGLTYAALFASLLIAPAHAGEVKAGRRRAARKSAAVT